jgi:hypothetical protein
VSGLFWRPSADLPRDELDGMIFESEKDPQTMLSLGSKCSLLNFNEIESRLCHDCDLAMTNI